MIRIFLNGLQVMQLSHVIGKFTLKFKKKFVICAKLEYKNSKVPLYNSVEYLGGSKVKILQIYDSIKNDPRWYSTILTVLDNKMRRRS